MKRCVGIRHAIYSYNGRLHRWFIHHALAAASYSPPALVFPVTAASMKSFRAKDGSGDDHGEPWEGGRNGGRDFRRTAISFGRWAVHRYARTSIRAAKNTEGILQSKGGQRPRCFLGWPSGCHCRRKQGGFGVQRQSFVEGSSASWAVTTRSSLGVIGVGDTVNILRPSLTVLEPENWA